MGGGFGSLSALGGFIIWAVKLFRGSWKEHRGHQYAFEVGLGAIMLFVLFLYLKA